MRAITSAEDVLRRGEHEKERDEEEGENACTYVLYVCACMWIRARVSAWQSVGAYGDPAALDEWVENQGRSEDRRETLSHDVRVSCSLTSRRNDVTIHFCHAALSCEKFALFVCKVFTAPNIIRFSQNRFHVSFFLGTPVYTCFAPKTRYMKNVIE